MCEQFHIYLSIVLSIYRFCHSVCPYIVLSIYLSLYLSIYHSVSIYRYIYLSIRLSIRSFFHIYHSIVLIILFLSIHPSVRPFTNYKYMNFFEFQFILVLLTLHLLEMDRSHTFIVLTLCISSPSECYSINPVSLSPLHLPALTLRSCYSHKPLGNAIYGVSEANHYFYPHLLSCISFYQFTAPISLTSTMPVSLCPLISDPCLW